MPPFCLVGGYKTFESKMLPYSSSKKRKIKEMTGFPPSLGIGWSSFRNILDECVDSIFCL
jgi:hypothetical protein